jgi:hypothetical protein
MFKIIRSGEFEPMSIKSIRKIESRIDFSPIYQRYGNIWSNDKKKLLIDTIINGFDIPKFYFNYFIEQNNVLNPKESLYAVIDGKQRLEAIFDFLNNKFTLDSQFIYYSNSNIDLRNLSFTDIANNFPDISYTLENYVLDVVYIITDEEDKLEELFLRLNGGSALTNAEKRNAISGHLNRSVKQIVENNDFFINKLRFKNPRFQYQDLLTKLLYIESNNQLISLTNSALESFVRQNITQTTSIDNTISDTVRILSVMSSVFEDKDILLKGKGIIPVYYYFISRNQPNITHLRDFFERFEDLRDINRVSENPNPTLINFDRRNQQGVYQDKSLNERLEVLIRYYQIYLTDHKLTLENLPKTDDIQLDDSDETGFD